MKVQLNNKLTQVSFLTLGVMGLGFLVSWGMQLAHLQMSMDQLGELKDRQIASLIDADRYKCCLEEPCGYCLFKNKGQDGLVCDCLKDVMEGEAPCGECVGEILEGEGNPLLAAYFSKALIEEFGEANRQLIDSLVNQRYPNHIKTQSE